MIIRILKKYSIPAVTHIQDIYPESFTNRITYYKNILKTILLPIDLFVLKNSAKIIANSNLMYSTFVENRGITPGKIEIVQNWRNETEFLSEENSTAYQPVRNYKTRPFTFMFLGNIGPVAGVDFIIKCFAEACFKDVSLIIAGCGSEKESCKKLAESFNNSNIEFWNVPPGSVPVVQELADVMLLPLKKCTGITSIPSKLLAYMFSKKPILACVDEYSDTAYAINKGRCGWVLPPENAEILVNTIKSIISIPHDDLKILGNNGYNYALENYSRKMNLKRLVSVIENALRP
jgi:glycosyltransferase involved in cell wall biosynthesis